MTPPFLAQTLLIKTEALVETINTTAAVNQLLSAGEERMTLGADFHSDILLGRTGLDHLATRAADGRRLVLGMNSLFHACHLFLNPVTNASIIIS